MQSLYKYRKQVNPLSSSLKLLGLDCLSSYSLSWIPFTKVYAKTASFTVRSSLVIYSFSAIISLFLLLTELGSTFLGGP